MIRAFAISRPLIPSPSMINRLLACFVLFVASVTGVRVAAQAPAERYRTELQPLIEDLVHQQQIRDSLSASSRTIGWSTPRALA